MISIRRATLLLGLLLFILPLSACSLLLDFDQCATASDCESGQTCTDGICEGTPSCSSQKDCPGEDNFCLINRCTVVDSKRCQLSEAFTAEGDEPIVPIGAVMPLSGTNAERGRKTILGADVALKDINQAGGAQGAKFGLITCDTAYDPVNAVNESRYLQSIGVKAIIGGFSSAETLEVANQVAIPNDILLISPASTAPTISGLQDQDLVWRTVASDALQGPAMGVLMGDVLMQKGIDPAMAKVALINVDSVYGNGLRTSLVDYWLGGQDFKGLPTDTSRFANPTFAATEQFASGDSVSGFAEQLFTGNNALKPDVILLVGSSNALNVIALLERDTINNEATKPTWILSEALRNPTLLSDTTNFQTVWPRIQGTVISQPETDSYTQFLLLYNKDGNDASKFPFADKAYDAAHIIAIAMASYSDLSTITGKDLAARLKKMNEGTERQLIATDFNAAAQDLAAGNSINIKGASGSLDFDLTTGDVFSDIIAWTIDGNGPSFKNGKVLVNSQ